MPIYVGNQEAAPSGIKAVYVGSQKVYSDEESTVTLGASAEENTADELATSAASDGQTENTTEQ